MVWLLVKKQEGYADGNILAHYPKGVIIVEEIIVAATAPGAAVKKLYVGCLSFMCDYEVVNIFIIDNKINLNDFFLHKIKR